MSLIEIKFSMFDAIEVQMAAQLQQALEIKRSQTQVMRPEDMPPQTPEPAPGKMDPEPAPGKMDPELAVEATYEEPVGEPDPALDVSDVGIARTVTELAQRIGIPAVRALIEEFGVKNATAIPAEKRAEFVSRANVLSAQTVREQ